MLKKCVLGIEKKPFQELPFYDIYVEKPNIKRLKNIDLLFELPFYQDLHAVKTDKSIKGYAMTYKAGLIDKKDPLTQLEAIKSSIEDLFNDLLDETKSFKYHIKVRKNTNSPVYFKSTTKTVTNDKSSFEKAFQEIFYRI